MTIIAAIAASITILVTYDIYIVNITINILLFRVFSSSFNACIANIRAFIFTFLTQCRAEGCNLKVS